MAHPIGRDEPSRRPGARAAEPPPRPAKLLRTTLFYKAEGPAAPSPKGQEHGAELGLAALQEVEAGEDLATRALDEELRAADDEADDDATTSASVVLRFAGRVAALLLAIVRYHADLSTFFDELASGAYIQSTPEALLQHPRTRQLMAEAPARYGQLLLLLEVALPGPVRERCVVANVRHKGWDDAAMATAASNLDGVAGLEVRGRAQRGPHAGGLP